MKCIELTSIQTQIRGYIYNCVFDSEQAIVLLLRSLRYLKRLKEHLNTMHMVVRKDKTLVTSIIVGIGVWEQLESLRSLDQPPFSQVVTRSGAQEEAQTVPPGKGGP